MSPEKAKKELSTVMQADSEQELNSKTRSAIIKDVGGSKELKKLGKDEKPVGVQEIEVDFDDEEEEEEAEEVEMESEDQDENLDGEDEEEDDAPKANKSQTKQHSSKLHEKQQQIEKLDRERKAGTSKEISQDQAAAPLQLSTRQKRKVKEKHEEQRRGGRILRRGGRRRVRPGRRARPSSSQQSRQKVTVIILT